MRCPRPLKTVWLLLACVVFGVPAFSRAETDSTPCAKCHVQARTQPDTLMGRAMEIPGANPTLNSHPSLTFHRGDYSYRVETTNGQTTYSVTDGARTMTLPVLWSIGAGNQTWVLERDGVLYESLVSYYLAIDGLDITTGDEKLTPHTLEEAMGRSLTPNDAKACFGCHTTNSTVADKLSLPTLHPGISCERCHQKTQEHLDDILKGKVTSIPAALGSLSSEDTSHFCGQCHRTWELVVRARWRGDINVRFQPYRLANSKCFNGADPRISCVACHDPHQPLVQQASYYDAKCLACHQSAPHVANISASPEKTSPGQRSSPKSCPVAKSNCITCHMPKVNMLGGHLNFTDHQIRIARAGDPYPN